MLVSVGTILPPSTDRALEDQFTIRRHPVNRQARGEDPDQPPALPGVLLDDVLILVLRLRRGEAGPGEPLLGLCEPDELVREWQPGVSPGEPRKRPLSARPKATGRARDRSSAPPPGPAW